MLDNCNRRLSESVYFLLHRQTKQNKTSDQFIRIPVEIAANATRFRRPELGAFPPQPKPNAVEYEAQVTLCWEENPQHTAIRRVWGNWTVSEFSLPQSPPLEINVDEIHKNVRGMKPSGNFSLSCDIK